MLLVRMMTTFPLESCTTLSRKAASSSSAPTRLVLRSVACAMLTSSLLPPVKSIASGRPQNPSASRPGIMTSNESPKYQ